MSFGFAADVAKQLIALSTAIITLCVALADKLFSSQAIKSNSIWLIIALGLFVLSILLGLLCMMAITGTLGKIEVVPETQEETDNDEEQSASRQKAKASVQDSNKGTIYQSNISYLMKIQILFFLVGIMLSVVFLCLSACSQNNEDTFPHKTIKEVTNGVRVKRITNYNVIDCVKIDTLLLITDIKKQ